MGGISSYSRILIKILIMSTKFFLFISIILFCGCEQIDIMEIDSDMNYLEIVPYNTSDNSIKITLSSDEDFSTLLEDSYRMIAKTGGTIYLPSGEFFLNRRPIIEVHPNIKIRIRGRGVGATNFMVNNNEGGIGVCLLGKDSFIELSDFSLKETMANNGIGIEIIGNNLCDSCQSNVFIENIDIRLPEGQSNMNYFFDKAVSLFKVSMPRLNNVVISGIFGGTDIPDDLFDKGLLGNVGIALDSVSAPILTDCYVWSFRSGYVFNNPVSVLSSPIQISRCFAVGCGKGVVIENNYNVPVTIEECHYNCNIAGVELSNVKSSTILKALLLYNSHNTIDYTDVLVRNSSNIDILNNIFYFNSHSSRIGILIKENSSNIFIKSNSFSFNGTPVAIGSTCENIFYNNNSSELSTGCVIIKE